MPFYNVDPRKLAAEIQAQAKAQPAAARAALMRAALRGKRVLVKKSPSYTGQFRDSWKVRKGLGDDPSVIIENDAPHAGVIEFGARPHHVNREGIEALTRWAERVIGKRTRREGPVRQTTGADGKVRRRGPGSVANSDAKSIAFAIAKKIAKHGQKGKFIVKRSMVELAMITYDEMDQMLKAAYGDKGRR